MSTRQNAISRYSVGIISAFLAAAAGWPQTKLPGGWEVQGQWEEVQGWWVAQESVTVRAPLASGTVTRLGLRLGALQRPASCRVAGPKGQPLELSLQALDEEYRVGLLGPEVLPLPDSAVDVGLRAPGGEWLFRERYFIRPHPHWYEGEDRQRILAEWDQLPAATQHELLLKIEAREEDVGLWIDDRFVGGAEVPGFTGLRFTLSPGNAIRGVQVGPLPEPRAYVPIGLRGYQRPGPMKGVEMPVPRGAVQRLNGIPFEVAADGEEIDVGMSRWLAEKTGPEEFTDNYYTRSAFDARPEDILLAIPTDDYSYAHLLCVVDPDPAKTPVLTLRLTRFLKDYYDSGGRGAAIADSSVRLEKVHGRWPEGCQQLGRVKVKTANGEKSLPLLHVAIPLKCGHIQDVLEEKGLFYERSTQHLDLELTKELHPVQTTNHSTYSIKPLGRPSGVHVVALTLERAPVKVRLRSRQIGHIFYASEGPAFQVEMENRTDVPFAGRLTWRLTDYDGRSTEGGCTVTVPVQSAGKPYRVRVSLRQPRYGWFKADLALRDSKGRLVWEHPTSFALLPPDTRRAGLESPFGTWWFRSSHIGSDSIDEMAPLLQRLGFRQVCPGGIGPDGQELARHGLSLSMYPDFVRAGEQGPARLDEMVAKHPDVGWALIFHECGFGERLVYPPEFLGQQPPQLTGEQQKRFKAWWDRAIAYSQYCREKYPDVKLILGNSSLPFAVEFMRQGYPREYVDAFGDEDLGQAIPPEAPPGAFKSVYWLKEYAKLYRYDVPITSCYEWRGRGTQPGNLSELEQAQLYVRDALQGLAYRMPHINIGLLHDVGDAYYYSRWGSGGLCHRYPLLNPKISYVALATLTRELDRAVYQRSLETNSPSLYAMEFKKDGGFVYALWLPRGERKATATFAQDTPFTLTDMNGNSQEIHTRGKRAAMTVSASPSYLHTKEAIQALRGGPTACEPPPAKRAIVDPLVDLSRWEVVGEPDEQLETAHFDFPRHLGRMDLQVVSDEQKHRALQVTLQPQPDVPWPVSRYVVLRAKNSQPAPGQPTSVGLWVKGNSCWGRIFWEFQDSRGETFFSLGAPCDGWSVGDWKCRTFINFDGWNYLSVPLPFRYESGFYGPPEHHWTHTGGDGIVDYPIRFTRLGIELREKVVHLTDAVEVPDKSIRIRDLSVAYGPRDP